MRLVYTAAFACCACAHTPTLSDSIHTARQGLHAVTPAVEALPVEQWAADLRAAQAVCEARDDLETPQERRECLGPAKERAELGVRLKELYDQCAAILREAEDLARALEALQ